MKVITLQCGKTNDKAVKNIKAEYFKRLAKYVKHEEITLPDLKATKNLTEAQVKDIEGEQILKALRPGDLLILLDELGEMYNSEDFARKMQGFMNQGPKRIVFVIGGPYGFSESVYQKANYKLSLSRMTFSHQIIRALFAEQLYRVFSILNNDPYHHA